MNNRESEYPVCNLCGDVGSTHIFAEGKEAGKRIVRCRNCGLFFRNPRQTKASLDLYYKQKQFGRVSDEWAKGRQNVYRSYLEVLSKFRKKNNILDVGAGHGFFLAACQKDGWDCHGIEKSIQCRTYAEKKFNTCLLTHDIECVDFEDDFFDVVTFWNVLDHLSDPKSALTAAFRLIRPGGAILVRCPNASFHVSIRKLQLLLARISPVFYAMNFTVFHLYSFNSKTLSAILGITGFENITIRPARLSWTTDKRVRFHPIKDTASACVGTFAYIFYGLSGNTFMSPSIIAVGVKNDKG